MNGKFIISLDFELHWGVFDALTLEQYQNNLTNVRSVIDRLITLSDTYGVKLTFATVGLLFAENMADIKKHVPQSIPDYLDKNLNPFGLLNQIGANESVDPIHYAKSLIEYIKQNGNHEIGTHTFGHYNCLAPGQHTNDFNADLISARNIAKEMGIELKSIVFPKNQVNNDYLAVCKKNEISNYRGTEEHPMYNPNLKRTKHIPNLAYRFIRLIDAYINISGFHTYPIKSIKPDKQGLINLPSGRFYRAYLPKLSMFEFSKKRRIINAMKHAAKNDELFHLWWHPHNFGDHIEENFNNLETVFKTYKELNKEYNFQSATMTSLTEEILMNSTI